MFGPVVAAGRVSRATPATRRFPPWLAPGQFVGIGTLPEQGYRFQPRRDFRRGKVRQRDQGGKVWPGGLPRPTPSTRALAVRVPAAGKAMVRRCFSLEGVIDTLDVPGVRSDARTKYRPGDTGC